MFGNKCVCRSFGRSGSIGRRYMLDFVLKTNLAMKKEKKGLFNRMKSLTLQLSFYVTKL